VICGSIDVVQTDLRTSPLRWIPNMIALSGELILAAVFALILID
jgi:hypothetical protein